MGQLMALFLGYEMDISKSYLNIGRVSLFTIFLALGTAACSENREPDDVQGTIADIKVYKQASCGCCGKWIDHMESAGFRVEAKNRVNLNTIKEEFGISRKYQSCHTAVSDGFFFEGHIPAEVVQKFLTEKPPGAIGLAVPGMPVGSPGMEVGDKQVPYDVLLLKSDGPAEVYVHIDHKITD